MSRASESNGAPTREEIKRWLVTRIESEVEGLERVDVTRPLTDFGLESRLAISITGELEDWLDLELDPTIFFDFPTIVDLAQFLEEELHDG